MDECDKAQREEAALLAQALRRRKKTLSATGACHYCGEGVRSGLLFCSDPGAECHLDYERDANTRAKQGR